MWIGAFNFSWIQSMFINNFSLFFPLWNGVCRENMLCPRLANLTTFLWLFGLYTVLLHILLFVAHWFSFEVSSNWSVYILPYYTNAQMFFIIPKYNCFWSFFQILLLSITLLPETDLLFPPEWLWNRENMLALPCFLYAPVICFWEIAWHFQTDWYELFIVEKVLIYEQSKVMYGILKWFSYRFGF